MMKSMECFGHLFNYLLLVKTHYNVLLMINYILHCLKFPVNEDRRNVWIRNTGKQNWTPYNNDRLCSKHFEKKWFYKARDSPTVRLLAQAVPTIFETAAVIKPQPELQSPRKMVLCCVPNCDGNGFRKRVLPRWDMDIYKVWIERIQNEELTMDVDPIIAYNKYRICDRHFEDVCRIPGESRIKRDSLPTLHLPAGFQRKSETEALYYRMEKEKMNEIANVTLPLLSQDENFEIEEVGASNAKHSMYNAEKNSGTVSQVTNTQKAKGVDLNSLSKEELIQKVRSLQAHNQQLKNIINKQNQNEMMNNQQKKYDFNKCNFRHILLKFYYLGWNYHGYAVQEDTENTIEHHIFKALTKTCLIKDRSSSNYHRCGRTDKGVSSFGQTISIDVRSKLPKAQQHELDKEIDYCVILNKVLPPDIQCISWCPADENYSARFNCTARTYRYFFPKGNLNIEKIKTAANYLVGTHDYRNFCKMDVANGVVEFVRRINEIEIVPINPAEDITDAYTMYVAVITGSGFLWHQIRCVIGVLFLIGQEKEKPEVIKELLDVKTNPCKPDYNMASEIPLNLFACEYDVPCGWLYNAENLSHVLKKLKSMWTLQSAKTTMMKSMLCEIEKLKETTDNQLEQHALTECLMQGSKSRKYVSLMNRQKCESLENRIRHHSKKLKLNVTENTEQ